MLFTAWWVVALVGCGGTDAGGGRVEGDGSDSGAEADRRRPCRIRAEVCDGRDNNCNGIVDENPVDGSNWYVDVDVDTHGDAAASAVVACRAPTGSVALHDDCDDTDAAIHPGAAETCNAIDDDCDALVDDDDPDVVSVCHPPVDTGVMDTGVSDTGVSDTGVVDTGGGGTTLLYPAELLDLTEWKITLPIPVTGSTTSPLEITQPALETYTIDPYFHLNTAGDLVVFQAHVGGTTTSSSGYPRSELREMTSGGSTKASWSTSSGVHTMTITQAITHVPAVKSHVVAGQIHDSSDDVVMIRLEGSYLFVEGDGDDLGVLDSSYTLGEEFTVRLVASGGVIDVYYNDLTTPAVTVARARTGCYFKAGAYTQSNTSKGDVATDYGEVEIRSLVVTHL